MFLKPIFRKLYRTKIHYNFSLSLWTPPPPPPSRVKEIPESPHRFLEIYTGEWESQSSAGPQFKVKSKVFYQFKGTQDWAFFWLRFWNLRYFFIYVKILRFYNYIFLIGPLLGEVRFFRVVLGLRGMKKNFELGPTFFFFLLKFYTLNMTQY